MVKEAFISGNGPQGFFFPPYTGTVVHNLCIDMQFIHHVHLLNVTFVLNFGYQ